jgi:hypothetical protein
LLRQGKSLTYKRQDANYYWCGEEAKVASCQLPVASEKQNTVPREENVGTWPVMPSIPIQNASVGTRTISSVPSPATNVASFQQTLPTIHVPIKPVTTKKPEQKPKREPTGRRRLKDEALENLAGRIYERVNGLCADPALHISMAVSRKLVSRYNRASIEKALRLLAARRDIAKPAGFFVTVLRSEAKRFP